MKPDDTPTPGLRAAILAGCMIAFPGFGFAATFGVFLTPMSQDLGWGREVFSLSVAVHPASHLGVSYSPILGQFLA